MSAIMPERNTSYRDKIIIALDTPSLDTAEQLIRELAGLISFFKVGSELFTAHGWEAVDLVRKYKGRVFLDLKLHDIPNTVSRTVAVMCEHDIDMMTVHALGGSEMMRRVRQTIDERVETGKRRPTALGVTVLTSHSEEELKKELSIHVPLQQQVEHLARLAYDSGLDGVVSSPQETQALRSRLPRDFVMVTPGVRPVGSEKSDQKRTVTPAEALGGGADYLVIGRPVTAAASPSQAAEAIIRSIHAAE